ncbi:alpha/beta fold hydrolase [Yokenella regensburgei]|uniref:alpha/beta fold hydrolase n=1 Tax=Yokenella regensburgei TaxID=158877 RepID=UPI003ED88F10
MTAFREQGEGTPVMLLHGISSGASSWHKQMVLPGCRVLAWDMPGYGNSPMLTVTKAMASDYADALAALLDALRIERVVLVGHSLGALVASAFAASRPQRVQALVLASPAQGYGQAEPAQREQIWRKREAQISAGVEALAESRAAKLLHPGAREEDIATVAAGMRRLTEAGYLAAARMLAYDDIHRWLGDYRDPFEVWCGEQDCITSPEMAYGLALRYGMGWQPLAKAGHACYLDNPQAFNQQLLRVVEGVRHAGAN